MSQSDLWWRILCRLFGCKWKPYVSPVGWRNVRICTRCGWFNPLEEWRE